jgi:hypothetical protein
MIKFIRSLFKSKNKQCNIHNVIHSVTCGEPNKKGFADTYVNGEKTNIRMLLWDKEEVERLQKIGEKIHRENR